MALQLVFAIIILFQACNSKESGRVELIKIGLTASIVNMLCIEA